MKERNIEEHNAKKNELMEKCYDYYCENGLYGTGMKELAAHCGVSASNLYHYFKNKDDFNSYMLWLGWTQDEIDQMIKYIERYCKNGKN